MKKCLYTLLSVAILTTVGSFAFAGGGVANTSPTMNPVPEPSSIAALAMGMVGFAGIAIRRRKS